MNILILQQFPSVSNSKLLQQLIIHDKIHPRIICLQKQQHMHKLNPTLYNYQSRAGVVPIVLQSIAILLKFCNTYCNTLRFYNKYCNTFKVLQYLL